MGTSSGHYERGLSDVVQAGPQDGPLVILLHGFPEFWYTWRHQINSLVAQGFRVWAPDQRGYNLSEKPTGISAYDLNLLAPIVGLMMRPTRPRFYHRAERGGGVAWWVANAYPQRVDRLVVLNSPPLAVFRQRLRTSAAQRVKSSYIFLMQIPRLLEALTPLGNWRLLTWVMLLSSRPRTFAPNDLRAYREAW